MNGYGYARISASIIIIYIVPQSQYIILKRVLDLQLALYIAYLRYIIFIKNIIYLLCRKLQEKNVNLTNRKLDSSLSICTN